MEQSLYLHSASSKDEEYTYQPTRWWSLYKQDMSRYKRYRMGRPLLAIFMTEQGLWAILQYRIASAVYRSRLPRLIKVPLLALAIIWLKIIQMTTGISIVHEATIGPGFYIGHFGNIFIGGKAVLGHTCNISQGVSIGLAGRGEKRGYPTIGNRVFIGANAVVVGKITVGDDAVIAANSLVVTDVAAHTTVMGVPARSRGTDGSEAYINPPA